MKNSMNINRNDKMKLLISIIGETLKKHEIIDIINMSNNAFDYYYKEEINHINRLFKN